jgi:hypothetical protein
LPINHKYLIYLFNMVLQIGSEPEWKAFFLEAGIPDTEADVYAKTFNDNRLKASTLPDLSMELIKSLGITIIGDTLAIIRLEKSKATVENLPAAQSASSQAYKAPSAIARLPTIHPEMTHPQFRKFRVDWGVYKQMTAPPYITHCKSSIQRM